ncbi:MAG: DUF1289 domain-containing protein [Hyphomicrobiales bacterium]
MQSPCMKICMIDEATRQCLGCGRSLREIGGWTQMTDLERKLIMDDLPARMKQLPKAQP